MQPKNREEKKEIILHTTISYNHFQNILRLFDVLPNFTFTTSETMLAYLQTWKNTCCLTIFRTTYMILGYSKISGKCLSLIE